jgi:hypothetical protein
MRRQLLKKYILILYTLLVSNLLFSQVEYFVKVDPATCNYTIIDSLSGVKWIVGGSSFDKLNQKYIFDGQDANHSSYLYSIDAVNANIISNPPWVNYLTLMKFDNATGILYGLYLSTTLANTNFVSINPTNLTYTNIHQINISAATGDVTFDDANHKFICIAFDSIGTRCLFSIDATTGNVISKPIISNTISGIQFDNSSGNLYGLKWDNSSQTESFVSINITTGNASVINSIPIVNQNFSYTTFDEINKRYTFAWTNSDNNNYLYTINASNGTVISNPSFPAFANPYNLIEFKYNNSTGNLYALHWGPIDEFNGVADVANPKTEIIISPNPSSTIFNISLPTRQNFNLQVVDITGHIVYINKNATGNITVDCSNFSSGVYFVKAINERTVLTGKLVKE